MNTKIWFELFNCDTGEVVKTSELYTLELDGEDFVALNEALPAKKLAEFAAYYADYICDGYAIRFCEKFDGLTDL